MSALATIPVDPPSHGPFLARWGQPYLEGDDALDWYVTTGGVPRKVQRDWWTDDEYCCQVLVEGGTSTFVLEDGARTSPAAGWITPNLAGLGMRWDGQDGSVAFADFTDDSVEELWRDGHVERTLLRWVHSEITDEGSGTTPEGTQVLGHHVFLHYRADLHDVVELEVLFSNASARVGTQGNGIWDGDVTSPEPTSTLFGTIGFHSCELEVPAGWAWLSDRPLASGGGHCFPTKMGTSRRFVIYKIATAGAATAAQELLEQKGLGRAYGGRDFHTVRAYGPSKSILPDLAQGFSHNGSPGYSGAKLKAQTLLTNLRAQVQSGLAGGGLGSPRFGLFHIAGEPFAGAPGGEDIEAFSGFEQVRESVLHSELYASCKADGCGIFLFHRDTGRPLRTSDFGDAYNNPSHAHPGYFSGPQYLGRQPFPFYTQNDSGYGFKAPRTRYFTGWDAPRWPPNFFDNRPDGSQPSGAFHYPRRVQPVAPALWGDPPSSLMVFTCTYRPVLEQVLQVHSLDGLGRPWYFQVKPFFVDNPGVEVNGGYHWKDPEDSQHAKRMYAKLVPSIWLGVDCLSKLVLEMIAEWFALEYSEVGHLPVTSGEHDGSYGQPGQPASALEDTPNQYSLPRRLQLQQSAPQTAKIGCGRSDGWVGELFATEYAVVPPERRDSGYPAKGIRKRCEMMFDFIRTGVLPYGATYKVGLLEAGGQLINAWGYVSQNGQLVFAPQNWPPSPPPISTQLRMMQINLELPLVHWAMFCLGRQLGRTDFHEQVVAAYENYIKPVERYTYYSSDPSKWGPFKYFAVWDNGTQTPLPGTTAQVFHAGSGTPGWPNCALLIEMYYRISGDPDAFRVANYLGRQLPPLTAPLQRAIDYMQTGGGLAQQFTAGLMSLLQHAPGPDIGAPPPNPPAITGVVPRAGLPGSQMRIFGTGFDAPDWTAELSGTPLANQRRFGDTLIVGQIPLDYPPGTVTVQVITQYGTATYERAFEVVAPNPAPPEPVITSVTPTSGVAGTLITIEGLGFDAESWEARLRNDPLDEQVLVSDTQIQGRVPDIDSDVYPVEVSTAGGEAELPDAFEVLDPPTDPPVFEKITPSSGEVGTLVEIAGSGFAVDGLQVLLGGRLLEDLVLFGDTLIQGAVPRLTAGVHDLVITTSSGEVTIPGAFALLAPPDVPELPISLGTVPFSFTMQFAVLLSMGPPPLEFPPVDPPIQTPPPEFPVEVGVPADNAAGLAGVFSASGDPSGDNVLLSWSLAGGEFRLVDGDLQRESGLAAAVLISLFSDARTAADRDKAMSEQDLRGWWAEIAPDRFGSHLWLLERAKATDETLRRAQDFARAALAWMLEERIAREVRVQASWHERTTLLLQIVILRGDARRWARLWRGALDVRIRATGVVLQLVGS